MTSTIARSSFPIAWPLVLALALAHGCSSSGAPQPTPGTGGAGGLGNNGGNGGAPTGGSGGAATGGAGSGGAAGGGAGSGGNAAGGAGGGGLDAAPADASGGGMTLDDCFVGLRALATLAQTATKKSADGAYQVRLALEVPPGSVGTSGTIPWTAIRVAIVTPQRQVCIKDEAALATAYKGSHHNCSDQLVVTADGLSYELKAPDTDVMNMRTTAILTVTGEAAIPPVTLTTASCVSKTGAACRSGGPCQ